jgi:outer membrane protein
MKKNLLKVTSLLAMSAMMICSMSSCGDKTAEKPAAKAKVAVAKTSELPNYRYVDVDTILSKYNLAKDYNEDMIRRQTNLENTGRQKENSIQNYANSVQKKYQNNTYLTQEDQKNIQAEQQKIANMQSSAQREMEKLQADYTNAASQAQQAINDSIEAFIQEYNKKRGYDAIFFKAATLYIDPALDITDEVIEGLNARYNKMKK